MAAVSVVDLLAHQGGWDEIALVVVPIALFAALLYVANRRAERMVDQHGGSDPDDDADPPV